MAGATTEQPRLYFESVEDLRDYVHHVLCQHVDLDLGTPVVESLIRQGSEVVAIEFTLLGPRSVRLSAIWEGRGNNLLFFDQAMRRFRAVAVTGLTHQHLSTIEPRVIALRSVWRGKG